MNQFSDLQPKLKGGFR